MYCTAWSTSFMTPTGAWKQMGSSTAVVCSWLLSALCNKVLQHMIRYLWGMGYSVRGS